MTTFAVCITVAIACICAAVIAIAWAAVNAPTITYDEQPAVEPADTERLNIAEERWAHLSHRTDPRELAHLVLWERQLREEDWPYDHKVSGL